MPYIGQRSVQVHPVSAVTVPDINRVFTELANTETSLWAALQSGNLTVGGLKLDTQRPAVPGAAPGALDPNVVAVTSGGVTTFYGWDGAAWSAFGAGTLPAVSTTTSASPTGTTSLTGVMMGLGAALTPGTSSQVSVLVTGQMQNTTLNDGVTVQVAYGTGSAPANGAAPTGTLVGSVQSFTEVVVGLSSGFAVGALVTGLIPGTAYWFDVQVAAVTGGTASVTGVTVLAQEV